MIIKKMKNIQKNITALILLLFVSITFAQQDIQFTHYMYNPSTINPAFAGFRNTLSGTFIHRSQWLGVKGAPSSQALSIQSPLKNENVAVGGNLYYDVIGATTEMALNGDFAYTIMTENSNINFGIKAGVQSLSIDPNKLTIRDANDPSFSSLDNQFSPQIGAGIMFETTKLYLGFSVPNLLEPTHKNVGDNTLYDSKERRNYYTSVGYIFSLSENTLLKASALSKIVLGAPAQFDVSGNFWFNEKLVLGAAYRVNAAASALVGYQFPSGFMIGASYDYDTTSFSKTNSGSAEFVLRYELVGKKSKTRILNPRIF